MSTNTWRGTAASIAQINQGTITTNANGDTYTGTLTDDNGATVAVVCTLSGSPANVTAAAAQFIAAWNAYPDPRVQAIVASAGTAGQILFTSAAAGVPFSLALTAGGTTPGAWSSAGVVTASSGPNDYGVASNWTLNAVPVATNDVRKPNGTPAIQYSLNQSSVAIASFTMEDGDANQVGRYTNGVLYPLRIDPGALTIKGRAQMVAIDVGSAAIAVVIDHTGTPPSNLQNAVYIKGSAITFVDLTRGNAGVAQFGTDTATITGGFNASAGTTLRIGPGCTVSGTVLNNNGGTVYASASIPTVNNYSGTFTQVAGNWATLNGFGGVAYPNSDGTYATTVAYSGFQLLNTQDEREKTFTDLTAYVGATIRDPLGAITWTDDIIFPGGIVGVTLDFGFQIKFKPIAA